jgi:hypothetical protein
MHDRRHGAGFQVSRRANYQIEKRTPAALVLRDLGPWDRFQTITNAAEDVVAELSAAGDLTPGCRLFYQDSEGDPTEIRLDGQRFAGFGHWDGGMPG